MKIICKRDGEIMLEDYLAYLNDNRNKFPPSARDFALLPYHYQMGDRRCPHDSWVDSISITETGTDARKSKRNISIVARFLGAYQDGFFDLIYNNVKQYNLSAGQYVEKSNFSGHGDWIVDEILLTSSDQVSHEIEFSNGGLWYIICEDIMYSWNSIS
jgi:hypothetical protein